MRRGTSEILDYIRRIKDILQSAREQSLRAVNSSMVAAYWYIGKEIIEEEQRGKRRAEYGKKVLQELAEKLVDDFGKGFSVSNLKLIRQFYLAYQDRVPAIRQSVIGELPQPVGITPQNVIRHSTNSEFKGSVKGYELSWTHYVLLMRISRVEARNFYEMECVKSHWSVRQLERQIGSLLYDRLAKF